MTKLCITPDGRILSLWDDDVPLGELGTLRVRRASHVEYDDDGQRWTVRPATRLGCPVVHQSPSRAQALAWEHENFQPGGLFWNIVQTAPPDRRHVTPEPTAETC